MVCSNCGAENRVGRKFCANCGSALALVCTNCGAPNEPDDRFCGECGTALAAAAPPARGPTPVAERRLVSVLFADLVGFTTLSESRDPEEVRELLSGYFESARRLIARYGGTVEKFIGDAVMAVWGAPVAREDDAERAVRAGLELVDAVASLGEQVGAPGLALRAGVATGETAVTLGALGQGMVAGDLVNTASRVQSAAAPGAVFVTDATRHATEASIAFEDAGTHELKGKAEPVALSRAVRVIALRGGELRSVGLESPFVGRDREFRLLKDLFHASAEDDTAHLLSVTGIGGIGKSRLTWEFFKYVDGLLDDTWWHRGRCIAYGDGVTYWALAEMVRMRARIAEEEEPAAARDKLRAVLADVVADEDDRRFIEPRLAHLLGLEDLTSPSKEDLFAGWRLFFERLSDRSPVLMIFEDLQWADESMLDFIEYLLEWSRGHPLFVVTLARPELLERRPTWGASRHGSTSMSLEPLPDGAMDDMLQGMVPGLSDELRTRIRERAEGVPLYAVETVRMLLDRGLVRREGDRFEPTGAIDELAVPETLQALIASRLDGLPPEERSLLQDASVLGKTFTTAGIATISGRAETELAPLLSSLVRKELLGLQADPRSPERGQYGFLQSLVQKVAYDTLSKRDRKARHLAAAAYLERSWVADEDEIVEVLASHLLEAYRLGPGDEDAESIRGRARETLTRAGVRARSLAATRSARGYFQRAAELTEEPVTKGRLLEQAGAAGDPASDAPAAIALYEGAAELFESAGLSHDAARVSARAGEAFWLSDRPEEGAERMEQALQILADEEPDHDLALLQAILAKVRYFAGDVDAATRWIEPALQTAEELWLPDVLSEAMNTKALIAGTRGRHEEELALLKRALELALENDLPNEALRAYNNLSYACNARDRFDDALAYQESGLAFAERLGVPGIVHFLEGHRELTWFLRGEWDRIAGEAALAEEPGGTFYSGAESRVLVPIYVAIARGELAEAERLVERYVGDPAIGDVQTRCFRLAVRGRLASARGDHRTALENAQRSVAELAKMGLTHDVAKASFVLGLEAAIALEDAAAADALLAIVTTAPRGETSPALVAHARRFDARLAALRGEADAVEPGFAAAEAAFRELGMRYPLGQTLLEHGRWLIDRGLAEDATPLLEEARSIFERLAARPALEEAQASLPQQAPA